MGESAAAGLRRPYDSGARRMIRPLPQVLGKSL